MTEKDYSTDAETLEARAESSERLAIELNLGPNFSRADRERALAEARRDSERARVYREVESFNENPLVKILGYLPIF